MDGRGVVGHAGARLLADLANVTGLTSAFGPDLAEVRQRPCSHDPGRVAVNLTAMIADGGRAIADLAVLRDQANCSGRCPRTCRLAVADRTTPGLARLRQARATARELA